MPRAKTNKLYRTFTKGLITEAGYLTYPEDSSIDELNTVISRKGNRTRRLGMDYEEDYVLNDLDVDGNKVINEHTWRSVNNDSSVGFVCVQVGSVIHFFTLIGEGSLSSRKKNFTIDLLDYKIDSAPILDLTRTPVEFSSGFGLLFIAHKYIDPLTVEYKPETDTIEAIRIVIQIRDLEGVYDGLANDEEPGVLSREHQYNLQNQGWLAPGTRTIVPTLGGGTNSDVDGATGGGSGSGSYYDPYTGNEETYTPGGGGSSFRPDVDVDIQ